MDSELKDEVREFCIKEELSLEDSVNDLTDEQLLSISKTLSFARFRSIKAIKRVSEAFTYFIKK